MAYPVLIFFLMVLIVGMVIVAFQKVFHVRGDRGTREPPNAAREVYVHPKVRELKRRERD